jgi:hypothetical protein
MLTQNVSAGQDHQTRADRFLSLLRKNRKRQRPTAAEVWPDGLGWVPLPEVQVEAGAQHGARKKDLKRRGHIIENKMLRQPNGERWSWYRLVFDAEFDTTTVKASSQPSSEKSDRLFPDDAPLRHLDLG